MQGNVELTVAAAVEAVPFMIPRPNRNRCRALVHGKRRAAAEPTHVGGLRHQLGGHHSGVVFESTLTSAKNPLRSSPPDAIKPDTHPSLQPGPGVQPGDATGRPAYGLEIGQITTDSARWSPDARVSGVSTVLLGICYMRTICRDLPQRQRRGRR